MTYLPLRLNLGGTLDSSHVFGRDALVDRLWETARQQSILLTSERRIGKTSVLSRMEARKPDGWIIVRLDVEGTKSPEEFTQKIIDRLDPHMTTKGRTWTRLQALLTDLGGTKLKDVTLPSIKPHWKRLMEAALQDVLTHHPGERVMLFLDEFPWFLDAIEKQHGWQAAAEVLDFLRALRQQESGVRMIYTGSIGLHHITARLDRHGYGNKPVNDLAMEEVPPLDEGLAMELAGGLLVGEKVPVTNLEACAEAIALEAGGVPFYIQHLVNLALRARKTLSPGDVPNLLVQLFLDSTEAADFRHFHKRLSQYYGSPQAGFCEQLLDAVAPSPDPLPLRHLRSLVPMASEEQVKELLLMLMKDHYLFRELVDNVIVYRFRYEVVRKWWVHDRELGTR